MALLGSFPTINVIEATYGYVLCTIIHSTFKTEKCSVKF